MKITIVGAGVIGLCAAYYLQQAGHDIEIIDKDDLQDGCSYGNAGMVVPSHFIPLAAPGMISKGIRWMFNPESPFYIKPRLNKDLISWGLKFYKASSQKNVDLATKPLRDLNLLSKKLYQDFHKHASFQFAFEEKGLLVLFKKKETEHEEHHIAQIANQIGIKATVLTQNEIQEIEPDVKPEVLGGVLYPGDAHLDPGLFISNLKTFLLKNGANIRSKTEVLDFERKDQNIAALITSQGTIPVQQVVIAGGSWTAKILKKLNINLPLQPGKGYSITLPEPKQLPKIPSIFAEAKVAVTPMNGSLRFAGTMELAGLDQSINIRRVEGILKAIPKYYPTMEVQLPKKEKIWSGLRPCSPDGLPYIGNWPSIENLTLATGHAMMGLSLGPATGKIVCEIISKTKTSLNINIFNPTRF